MTILCLPNPRAIASRFLKTCAEARPSFSAVSAVTGSTLAVPRTPSVPKIFFRPFSLLIPEAVDFSLLFDYFNLNSVGHQTHQINPARWNINMNFQGVRALFEFADFNGGAHFARIEFLQRFFGTTNRDLHIRGGHFELAGVGGRFCDGDRMGDHHARMLGAAFRPQVGPQLARLKAEPGEDREAQRRYFPPKIVKDNV